MNPAMDDTLAVPILILLPVYNGGDYLAAQLDSILAQTHKQWLLLCRDDGSSDDSAALLADYAGRHPNRIRLISDELGKLGASGSFSRLMALAAVHCREAEMAGEQWLVALSDQDDIWYPEKLSRQLAAMQQLQQRHVGQALLVHGDLRVVDADGAVIAASMVAYQGLVPERDSLAAQLLSNTVTGCTTLMNVALLEQTLPVPKAAIMHDWWLSLVVAAFGQRYWLAEPLVDYRQHGGNTIGARPWQPPRRVGHWLRRLFDDSNDTAFRQTAAQAEAFRVRHGSALGWRQRLSLRLCMLLRLPLSPLQKVLFRLLRRLG